MESSDDIFRCRRSGLFHRIRFSTGHRIVRTSPRAYLTVWETGARIVRTPKEYGFGEFDRNDIAIVFQRMYLQFLMERN